MIRIRQHITQLHTAILTVLLLSITPAAALADDLEGTGTAADPYLITSDADFARFVEMANTADGASKCYRLTADVNAGDEITQPFTGIFEATASDDGSLYKISGLRHALFNTLNGGVVRNLVLDNVLISGSGNTGSVCNEAIGTSRIYNCGVQSGEVASAASRKACSFASTAACRV